MNGVEAIVVSYNSAATITKCLSALRDAGITTHLVDNGSADETMELAHAVGLEPIRSGCNVGFGAGVNLGMEEVDTPLALIVNPDCVVTAECVAELSRALDADENLAAVVPNMRYPDGSFGIAGAVEPSLVKEWLAFLQLDKIVPRSAIGRLPARFRTGMLSYVAVSSESQPRVVDWVCAWCMLIRTDAFRAVGGFDERYFLYFEDVDLCGRLRGRGRTVAIVPSASALHFESTSTSQSGKSAHYGRGLRIYYARRSRWSRWSSRLLANLMGA